MQKLKFETKPFYREFVDFLLGFFKIEEGATVDYGVKDDKRPMVVQKKNTFGVPMLRHQDTNGLVTQPKLKFFWFKGKNYQAMKTDSDFKTAWAQEEDRLKREGKPRA